MAVKDQVWDWSLTHNLIESAWKMPIKVTHSSQSLSGERHGGQRASESCSKLQPASERKYLYRLCVVLLGVRASWGGGKLRSGSGPVPTVLSREAS